MLGLKLNHASKRGPRYSNRCKMNLYSGDLILLSIFAKPQFCFSKMQNLAVSVKCRTWLQTCENKHEDTPDITSVCLWDCNIHLGCTAARNNWARNQHLEKHHISIGINFHAAKTVIGFCYIQGYPDSWGEHGAHLGPVGPSWAPCWPHEPCYQGMILYQ